MPREARVTVNIKVSNPFPAGYGRFHSKQKMGFMHYVYVLASSKKDNWHYYGSTSDLKRRFAEHSAGMVTSTRHYIPLTLAYYEAYLSAELAKQREHQLKSSRSASGALLKRLKLSNNNTGA